MAQTINSKITKGATTGFIKGYEAIAGPLTRLLKKGAFNWDSEADQAFEPLKKVFSTPSVLALPDFNQTFIVECDALGSGFGAVLMQEGRPISYFKKKSQR